MLHDQLVQKISDFINLHGIQSSKINEQQWGSYDPVFSLDGAEWIHFPNQTFGAGWDISQATTLIFYRMHSVPQFKAWIGIERASDIQKIFELYVTTTNGCICDSEPEHDIMCPRFKSSTE